MVLLIYRAEEYSPNNVCKDKAILDAVGKKLTDKGYIIRAVCETDLKQQMLTDAEFVLSMARRWNTLMLIDLTGVRSMNNVHGVQISAHSREMTMDMLKAGAIAVPDYIGIEPSEERMFSCEPELQALLPGWIKGMHPRGVTKADVRFVSSPLEADTAVIELMAEGYSDIVVTKHLDGKVLKCYCVTDGESFFWMQHFFPQDEGYSKFGAESHNKLMRCCVNVSDRTLKLLARQISAVLQLNVFGFDAIVDSVGNVSIIDVNDWPSFSKFKEEAADQIASLADIEISGNER